MVIFVGKGKGGKALEPFWKQLSRSGIQIEAVATDRGTAYIRAVGDNLPGATRVFNHFHTMTVPPLA